jgi:hypothetical protein
MFGRGGRQPVLGADMADLDFLRREKERCGPSLNGCERARAYFL